MPVRINEDNLFTVLSAGSWLTLVLFAAGGLLFGSLPFTGGVVAGGLIVILNFYWLRSILKRFLRVPGQKPVRFVQIRYVLRLAVMGLAIYYLISRTGISIFGLILGLSVIVVNIFLLTIYYLFRHKGE
ncbi:MAG: ATP synthase subunit I [Geobacter sp.]|nr:ATP synthase subunit I [Geobacter sp.]